MIKIENDYQLASTLIGIGCFLTITAYVARKIDVLKDYFPHEKVHLAGDTLQNFALITYVALPFFRNLIQTKPLSPLPIVCYALMALVIFELGEAASAIATGGLKKNNSVFEFLNVAIKVANMIFLSWSVQQKNLGRQPAFILGAASLSSIVITTSRVC